MGQELILTRVHEGEPRDRLWRDGVDIVAQTVMSSESSHRWSRVASAPTHFAPVALQQSAAPAAGFTVA